MCLSVCVCESVCIYLSIYLAAEASTETHRPTEGIAFEAPVKTKGASSFPACFIDSVGPVSSDAHRRDSLG